MTSILSISWNRAIALSPAGPQHRTYRKLVNTTLSISASKSHWSSQEKSARTLISERYDVCVADDRNTDLTGYEFLPVLKRRIGLSVVGLVYGSANGSDGGSSPGMTLEEMETYIHDADEAHVLFGKTLAPFAYSVDLLPWLSYLPEWFPFASFKKEARLAKLDLEKLTYEPYFRPETESFRAGISQTSFLDSCFAGNPEPSPKDEDNWAWTAMSAYTGGSDTTIASTTTVVLAASLYPEAQSLAQAELDQIVGHSRVPSMEDRDSLPYVTAFVQECLRIAPVVPLGVAHRAMEDDHLEGYYIPKGSTVITNIWHMFHDANVYSNPHDFNPSRFLPKCGTSLNSQIKGLEEPGIQSIPFGYGRRICPGRYLADSGVWILATNILWAFNIRGIPDRDPGKSRLMKDCEFTDGAISGPLPFRVDLKVRSEEISNLLNAVKDGK